LWDAFVALPVVADAQRIMVFDPVPGEPETGDLVERCRRRGVETVVPEADPDPSWPDLVVVPGLAFTRDGRRLGQGGGWYDRFLARTRCPKVGVCFDVQVVAELPVEDHDVVVDVVVTESGPQ
jgi:5-formyltetrahydrofolate cyclo-ligase